MQLRTSSVLNVYVIDLQIISRSGNSRCTPSLAVLGLSRDFYTFVVVYAQHRYIRVSSLGLPPSAPNPPVMVTVFNLYVVLSVVSP